MLEYQGDKSHWKSQPATENQVDYLADLHRKAGIPCDRSRLGRLSMAQASQRIDDLLHPVKAKIRRAFLVFKLGCVALAALAALVWYLHSLSRGTP